MKTMKFAGDAMASVAPTADDRALLLLMDAPMQLSYRHSTAEGGDPVEALLEVAGYSGLGAAATSAAPYASNALRRGLNPKGPVLREPRYGRNALVGAAIGGGFGLGSQLLGAMGEQRIEEMPGEMAARKRQERQLQEAATGSPSGIPDPWGVSAAAALGSGMGAGYGELRSWMANRERAFGEERTPAAVPSGRPATNITPEVLNRGRTRRALGYGAFGAGAAALLAAASQSQPPEEEQMGAPDLLTGIGIGVAGTLPEYWEESKPSLGDLTDALKNKYRQFTRRPL